MKENKNTDAKLNADLKGIYDSLTDEQKEQAKKCKTMDEMMKLAGEWGIELPDEMLDAVAGGRWRIFPDCHSHCNDCDYC